MGRVEDTAKTPRNGKGFDPFGLAIYGNSLLSKNVQSWITVFTVALIAQFCVDVWAWYHAWKYGTENVGFAVIGGLVFATSILLFDRSVIIHDTQHNKWSWLTLMGRLVVLFVLAFITAIPVELRIFESEINQRFDNREITLKDNIQKSAIKQESDFYGQQIEAQKKALAADNNEAVGAGNSDIEKYQSRRAAERQGIANSYAMKKVALPQRFKADKEALAKRYAADKTTLTQRFTADKMALDAQIQAIDKKIAEEAGGKYSGIVGIGPIVKSMQIEKKNTLDQMDKVRMAESEEVDKLAKAESEEVDKLAKAESEEVDKLAKAESAELTAFDRETTSKISELQTNRDNKIKNVKKERDDKIAELQLALKDKLSAVQAMTGEKLSKNYGGEWKVSRGFLDHFRELEELVEKNPSNKAIAWGVRLTMMALGLIIFFLKIMVGKGVKEYYSQGTQISHGADDVLDLSSAIGFTTPESRSFLGLGLKEQEAMMRVLKEQANVSDAIDSWLNEVRRWARPQQLKNGGDLCLSRAEVDGKLEERWFQIVHPAISELAKAERELRVPTPAWSKNLPHKDPRVEKDPWRRSDADLARWGWEDPKPLMNEAKMARSRHSIVMHELAKVLMSFEQRLVDMIKQEPTKEKRMVEYTLFQIFASKISPLLFKLEEMERTMRAGGIEPPPRLRILKNQVELEEIWKVNSGKLEELGWTGPGGQVGGKESALERILPPRQKPPTPAPEPTEKDVGFSKKDDEFFNRKPDFEAANGNGVIHPDMLPNPKVDLPAKT